MSGYMLHVIRQITTDRNYNRTLLKNRRNKKSSLISNKKKVLKFKEVSDSELKIIKQNIRKKGREDRLKGIILTLISIVVFFYLMYYIVISSL